MSAEDTCERRFNCFDWVSGEMEKSERPKVSGSGNIEISARMSLN